MRSQGGKPPPTDETSRDAGLCHGVSQVFNLQDVRTVGRGRSGFDLRPARRGFGCLETGGGSAGWKPAIQQVENLRYEQRRYELSLRYAGGGFFTNL